MNTAQPRAAELLSVSTRVVVAGAFLLLLLIACVGGFHDRGMAVDDAFISYRYADHLAHGLGLRWNPDSAPNEGYTNFLYVLGVAGLDVAGVPPPIGGLILGVAAAAAMIVLLAVVARGKGAAALLASGVVLLLLGRAETRVHASRGLETLLFGLLAGLVLVLAGSVAAARSPRRSLWLGASSVLLVMCRPDGLLIVAVTWAVVVAARGSGSAWRPRIGSDVVAGFGLFVVVTAAYVAWKWIYFGYLLPNSYYAKARGVGWPGSGPTVAFLRAYAPGVAAAWTICAAQGVVAVRDKLRRRGDPIEWRPLIATLASVAWCVYSLKIVHEMGFSHRFLQPIVALLSFGVCFALRDLDRRGVIRGRAVLSALAAGVVAIALATPELIRELSAVRGSPPVDEYTSRFRRLGEAIREIAAGRAVTLVCNHAGATPYYAAVHHVDPTGLVDDGFCARASKLERWRYRNSLRPDLIASHLFPAEAGAKDLEGDRRAMSSSYITKWCLGGADENDAAAAYGASHRSLAAREAEMFESMSFFRDRCTLVGEVRYPAGRWREFLYVRNDSPCRDEFIEKLARVVDVPASEVSFD